MEESEVGVKLSGMESEPEPRNDAKPFSATRFSVSRNACVDDFGPFDWRPRNISFVSQRRPFIIVHTATSPKNPSKRSNTTNSLSRQRTLTAQILFCLDRKIMTISNAITSNDKNNLTQFF
jgi:hypothetical protein